MKHTPTPWSVGASRYHGQTVEIDTDSRDPDLGYGNWLSMIECCGSNENPDIGIQKAMANAQHIVRCANYHDRLVESLAALADFAEQNDPLSPVLADAKRLLTELEQQK